MRLYGLNNEDTEKDLEHSESKKCKLDQVHIIEMGCLIVTKMVPRLPLFFELAGRVVAW